ncbi:MAG: hypothetical protein SOY30_04340 [Eubacteriales bacterium]|nr:hypothetical protein [Eubacteriales bacterium]
MKRALVLLAVLFLALSATAWAEGATGAWQTAADTALTPERLAPLEEALSDLVGVAYEPVAYLGNQVVAGLNHCYLCRATVVYPDAQPSWKLVYVYEPLEGVAEITRIADLDLAAFATPLSPN